MGMRQARFSSEQSPIHIGSGRVGKQQLTLPGDSKARRNGVSLTLKLLPHEKDYLDGVRDRMAAPGESLSNANFIIALAKEHEMSAEADRVDRSAEALARLERLEQSVEGLNSALSKIVSGVDHGFSNHASLIIRLRSQLEQVAKTQELLQEHLGKASRDQNRLAGSVTDQADLLKGLNDNVARLTEALLAMYPRSREPSPASAPHQESKSASRHGVQRRLT